MKLGLGSLVDAMSKHSSSGGGIRGMVMEGSCAHVLCTEGLQMGGYLCVRYRTAGRSSYLGPQPPSPIRERGLIDILASFPGPRPVMGSWARTWKLV